MSRRSTKDPDGFYKEKEVNTNQVTRLRRSLRGSAPTIPSKEAQFEKIISQFTSDKSACDEPILRQFHMPSHILADAKTILEKKESVSALESLQPTVILYILSFLEGNDQIMFALSCKTLASLVEASPTGKIANLTVYSRWPRKPGFLKAKEDGSTDAQFLRKGYGRPSDYGWYDEQCAARSQCIQLKDRVAKYLGPEYQWCQECKLFRLTEGTWWRELAEYEDPGVLEKQQVVDKLDAAIKKWSEQRSTIKPVLEPPPCPVHKLLEEDEHGRRTIMIPPKAIDDPWLRRCILAIFARTGIALSNFWT